jgi:hypothetical protein
MLSIIMALVVLIPLTLNFLSNRSATRLYIVLKHEETIKATTTRYISYKHYTQFHVARVMA